MREHIFAIFNRGKSLEIGFVLFSVTSHSVTSHCVTWRKETYGLYFFQKTEPTTNLLLLADHLENNLRNLFIEANRWFCKKLYHEKMWRAETIFSVFWHAKLKVFSEFSLYPILYLLWKVYTVTEYHVLSKLFIIQSYYLSYILSLSLSLSLSVFYFILFRVWNFIFYIFYYTYWFNSFSFE